MTANRVLTKSCANTMSGRSSFSARKTSLVSRDRAPATNSYSRHQRWRRHERGDARRGGGGAGDDLVPPPPAGAAPGGGRRENPPPQHSMRGGRAQEPDAEAELMATPGHQRLQGAGVPGDIADRGLEGGGEQMV